MLTADADLNVIHIHGCRWNATEGGRVWSEDDASITRRCGSAVAAAAAMVTGGPAMARATAAARPHDPGQVPTIRREFTRAPFTHPQIPYVGRAGHRGGVGALPPPPRRGRRPRLRRRRGRHHGLRPPRINRAIAAAGRAGGGTVLIPPGTFRIDGLIRIGHSNVVLRGAGSDRTKLYATRNLTELIGVYGSRYGGDKSSWSWAGGLIWLAPTARWDLLVAAIKDKAWPFEGWTGNKRDEWETLTTVAPATRGSWSVTVADPRPLKPGRLVLLRLADDADHTLLEHMSGGGPGPRRTTGTTRPSSRVTSPTSGPYASRVCGAERSPWSGRCLSTYAPSGTRV